MTRNLPTIVSGGLALLLCANIARADFVGLTAVLEFPSAMTLFGPRDVYHVFAEFTDPADRVNTWFGTADDPFVIQNVLSDGITLGSGFTNFGGPDSRLPPKGCCGADQWDTFATIGVRFSSESQGGSNVIVLDGPFPQFIPGNSVMSSDSGVFIAPIHPQGRGDWRVMGSDTNTRVLLMQLTVNSGEHVRGIINIGGQLMTPGGYENFTISAQTFTSVPAPGTTIVLLAFAYCGRRRRDQ